MSLRAVVPVKPFALAKQRLQVCCTPAARRTLARLMLEDVLDVLGAVRALDGIVVVTADVDAAALARARRIEVLDEPPAGGLNAAVSAAAQRLVQQGCAGMLVLPGDAPGVTCGEVDQLLAAHGQGVLRRVPGVAPPPRVNDEHAPSTARDDGPRLTIVPAHDGRGTNALALSPPTALRPAFGDDSFQRHLAAAQRAGLPACVLRLPGLGLDLDHPQDLARFAQTRTATRTWRFLEAGGLQATTG